jgi:hypothetical protein
MILKPERRSLLRDRLLKHERHSLHQLTVIVIPRDRIGRTAVAHLSVVKIVIDDVGGKRLLKTGSHPKLTQRLRSRHGPLRPTNGSRQIV